MIYYGASRPDDTLSAFVTGAGAGALDHARSLGASLVRFGATAAPGAELDRLLRRFVERFGAPPVANDAGTSTGPTGAPRDV